MREALLQLHPITGTEAFHSYKVHKSAYQNGNDAFSAESLSPDPETDSKGAYIRLGLTSVLYGKTSGTYLLTTYKQEASID